MKVLEMWRQRADKKEFTKIAEISAQAQKKWSESFITAKIRTVKIKQVYDAYGVNLTDQDYQYITLLTAYLEAIKTETPLARMKPDALALRLEIEAVKSEQLDANTSQDVQMQGLSAESLSVYALHVGHISQTALDITRTSSIPEKPREFFLATAVHANMLTQIRSGTITGAK